MENYYVVARRRRMSLPLAGPFATASAAADRYDRVVQLALRAAAGSGFADDGRILVETRAGAEPGALNRLLDRAP